MAAVVSQEPVYDDYRYLYGDGMRRENSLATPALYDGIAATPGPLTDDPNYNVDSPSTTRPAWPRTGRPRPANDDHDSDFWKLRNLIPGAAGSKVPLFLTQGLTENNTVADGLRSTCENHTGYERAWLGPWEHVRGNETEADGRLKMGRAGWFDEVMRFYDQFLKGVKPKVKDPMIAVQTNDGKWRAEDTWPPADSTGYTSELLPGSYTDEADGSVTDSDGVWTISPPLPYDAHLSGSGHVTVDVSTTLPRANLVVDVYDLDRDGTGPLITRQAHMIYGSGQSKIPLDLWSADWKIPAGHRIGVKVTDNNTDFWLLAAPTLQDVTVNGGQVTLPVPGPRAHEDDPGRPGHAAPELSVRHRDGAAGDDRELAVRLLHAAAAAEGRHRRRRHRRRRSGTVAGRGVGHHEGAGRRPAHRRRDERVLRVRRRCRPRQRRACRVA